MLVAEIGRLFGATRAIDDPGDLLALARACPDTPLFYWEHPVRRQAMLGLGTVRELRASGPERFASLSAAARRMLATIDIAGERSGLRVVGGFGFSDAPQAGAPWQAFPAARLVLPRLLWLRDADGCRLTQVWDEDDAAACAALLARLRCSGTRPAAALTLRAPALAATERARWRMRVDHARRLIANGEVRKVVLARQRRLHAASVIDPATILTRARDERPTCFTFWVRAKGGTSLVASTPELLVRRRGLDVTASALAGSAPRAADATADRRHASALLACPKNGREHAIVVAAVRMALASLADEITASPTPELLRLPEVQHLATWVTGRLRAAATVLEVGGVLHPTPAVCGAPRDAARALIEQDEPDRGWYTGTVGWMDDAGDGELAVALRSALVADRDVTLWAGAGIVDGSDADAELAETEAKMGALVAPFLAAPLETCGAAGPLARAAGGSGAHPAALADGGS
jgi:isochorismate synthase